MASERKPIILVTNDDGIRAVGIRMLKQALQELGRVIVVAPDRPRSSSSHSVTLHKPLRLHEVMDADGEVVYACNGTPADCVALGVRVVCPKKPKLIVSGINVGPNVGNDITYSGTVAAAVEGVLQGIPSFAISVAAFKNIRYEPACFIAKRLAEKLLRNPLPPNVFLNVNVPNLPLGKISAVQITRRGDKRYVGKPAMRRDPLGKAYYWRGTERPVVSHKEGTDVTAVAHGCVSITPLQIDNTSAPLMGKLREWANDLLDTSKS